jgi:hypothetical protein
MALDVPSIIGLAGPDMQALIPDEKRCICCQKGKQARRNEHQTDNIHGRFSKLMMRQSADLSLGFAESP